MSGLSLAEIQRAVSLEDERHCALYDTRTETSPIEACYDVGAAVCALEDFDKSSLNQQADALAVAVLLMSMAASKLGLDLATEVCRFHNSGVGQRLQLPPSLRVRLGEVVA
jgi:hypothetical protein